MEAAIIGVVGVVVGVLLMEFIRRQNRIEPYTIEVFKKRLDLYIELYSHMNHYQEAAGHILENNELTGEERHNLVSKAVLDLAGFCDRNQMLLNEEITLHCIASIMGIENVPEMQSKEDRDDAVRNFQLQIKEAKQMIRKEAGVSDVDKLFHSITKPNHSSAIIDLYRKEKSRQENS